MQISSKPIDSKPNDPLLPQLVERQGGLKSTNRSIGRGSQQAKQVEISMNVSQFDKATKRTVIPTKSQKTLRTVEAGETIIRGQQLDQRMVGQLTQREY